MVSDWRIFWIVAESVSQKNLPCNRVSNAFSAAFGEGRPLGGYRMVAVAGAPLLSRAWQLTYPISTQRSFSMYGVSFIKTRRSWEFLYCSYGFSYCDTSWFWITYHQYLHLNFCSRMCFTRSCFLWSYLPMFCDCLFTEALAELSHLNTKYQIQCHVNRIKFHRGDMEVYLRIWDG